MAKFWEQDWFRDALPYAVGALATAGAVAGVGANRGWFDSISSTGLPGADAAASIAAPAAQVYGPPVAPEPGFLSRAAGFVGRNPGIAVLGGIGALTALNSSQEPDPQDAAKRLADQTAASRQADRARWDAIPFRPMSSVPTYATPGGARPGAQAATGGERRYFAEGGAIGQRLENGALVGPGDGLSDDIPAVAVGQDGQQRPVMVADGEYVIAADVVSGIGNGSTQAGIRWLDDLQERVRGARTGGSQPGPIQQMIGAGA